MRMPINAIHHWRGKPVTVRRATYGDAHRIANRRFHLYVNVGDDGWKPLGPSHDIVIRGGKLYVGGVRVLSPRVTADHISWNQHAMTATGASRLVGILHLHSNGYEAHGTVSFGDGSGGLQTHDVFATALPDIQYTTAISIAQYPPGTKPSNVPAGGWQDGLSLSIGYQQQIGESVPTPVVTLDDQDISQQCSWSIDDSGNTKLSIALDDVICSFAGNLYATAYLAFNPMSLNPPGIGMVTQKCGGDVSANGWVWQAMQASAASPAVDAEEGDGVTEVLHSDILPASPGDDLTVAELMTILPDDAVTQDAQSMLIRNMKWGMGQSSQEKDWLAQFFNQTPPVISNKAQLDLATKGLDWYQNKFAMSYLTQSFNGYDGAFAPTTRLSDQQAANLDAYLRTGLAKDSDFNVQYPGVFQQAFVDTKPRLQDYLNDPTSEAVGWAQGVVTFTRSDTSAKLVIPSGTEVQTAGGIVYATQSPTVLDIGVAEVDNVPVAAQSDGTDYAVGANTLTAFGGTGPIAGVSVTNPAPTAVQTVTGGYRWGIKLLLALTSGSQFTLMVNRVAGAAGDPKAMGPLNNLASLLTALDTSGTLAQNYYSSVISGIVVHLLPKVVHQDTATMMSWLPQTILLVFQKLANGELPSADISQAEGEEMYQEYLKNQQEVASAVADLLQSVSGTDLISQAKAAEANFEQRVGTKWPKLAKAGQFMFAIAWIGGVSSVITSLVRGDWSKMSDVEKAEFVTNIVQLTANSFQALPLIWKGVKYVTLSVWKKLQGIWTDRQQQARLENQRNSIAPDPERPLAPQEAENMNDIVEAGAEGGLGKNTGWARVFGEGILSGVVKIVGAVAAVAMAGFSLWQLIKDIKNSGSVSTIVFDSLSFAANALAAICVVADLFLATTWIPVAGALLAIAGVIIGVIAGFFEQPESPLETWMKDHGVPFANSLPPATA